MSSNLRNCLYPSFLRSHTETAEAPPATAPTIEDTLEGDHLLALSARLRKKERSLESLRLELAEWERLLCAREDYLRTCEANVSRPGRPSLEQREAALARRVRDVKERETLLEQQRARSVFADVSVDRSARARAAG